MKTFKEYLSESTKTYAVRVKIAGELPEGFDAKFKDYMAKYETVEFKKVGTTPVQEHPHEFPRIKNQEVTIYDIEASYPMSFQQLETTLADQFGISFHNLKVKHPNDPTEEMKDEDKVYEPKLQDAEYKDSPKADKPLLGDEYNMSLFKELMKTRSEQSATQEAGSLVSMGEENPQAVMSGDAEVPKMHGDSKYSAGSLPKK
tara:strand:- start:515 stop:1120 length:606 start_codon:yes stop_codon:yes gene_type:complete